jgi:hypothetical protein
VTSGEPAALRLACELRSEKKDLDHAIERVLIALGLDLGHDRTPVGVAQEQIQPARSA